VSKMRGGLKLEKKKESFAVFVVGLILF